MIYVNHKSETVFGQNGPIVTNLYSASYVSWQRGTARIRCWAPGSNRSISPATASPNQRRSVAETDGRTDGQTDTRPLHRPCSACYAGSTNNSRYIKFGGNMTSGCAVVNLWICPLNQKMQWTDYSGTFWNARVKLMFFFFFPRV